jgi:hypothetical protein
MVVYYDENRTYPEARVHPYGPASPGDSGFIDFKKSPELIRTSLEDFRPFEQWQAIQTFYSFLTWINGSDSELETNDCAFRPPKPHQNAISQLPLCAYGRVYVLFRDLRLNSSRKQAEWLCRKLMYSLHETGSDLSEQQGVVGFTLNPALQIPISTGRWLSDRSFEAGDNDPGFGYHLMLTFWGYGGDEEQSFHNLSRVFMSIWSACRPVSDEIRRSLSISCAKT